ncbi:hypothetical protein BC940DRAFT_239593 [Gongronella butleri]|nr:hypothetical protein BC940DRAFT_239593 [Gongronella butleri]
MENRRHDQRPIAKTFYYLDYKEFVDVVKWKMFQMQLQVRDKLKKESENQGYVCPQCNAQYSTLDAMPLARMGSFFCDICGEELKENDNAENVKSSQLELARLREQQQPIINLLKQTDSVVIPASYTYKPFYTGNKKNGKDKSMPVVPSEAESGGMGDIIVDLQMDNEAARRAKQLEAEEKRQQNALPVWHQRSTVSDMLAGTGDRPDTEGTTDDVPDQDQDQDQDLELDPETADYYAQYYESLSNAQNLEDDGTDGLEPDEDLEDDEEFEQVDVNPSQADVDEPGSVAGVKRSLSPEDTDFDDEDIPFVTVNGEQKRLDEISEEDQRNMTTDEYKAYYEAWQAWQNE